MKIPQSRRSPRWGKRTTWLWSLRLVFADKVGHAIAGVSRGGRLPFLSVLPPAIALSFSVTVWKVLLAYGIFLVIWAVSRAHVRVVIEAFDDYTTLEKPPGAESEATEKKDQRDAKAVKDAGAAVLLANRLAEMRELYGFIDDPDKTPSPGRAPGATVQLDDAASVLRSAVTTESSVSVGGISLPLGPLMGIVSRVVQAPRLQGAIHGDETLLVVTAELTVEGQPYSWRLAAEIKDGESSRRTLERMIREQLAYQVFSDLTLQRQAMWPATKFWLVALGKMAECQSKPRNRRLLLKEAEFNFTSALAEDERFYLACLNLGIVYRRLAALPGDPDQTARYARAARRVFERAIELRPDRWEAYHALAEANWSANPDGSLEMIVGLCDRGLARCSDRAAAARILDLKGHAQAAASDRRAALATRRRACRCILRELERTRLRQADPRQARRLETLEKQAAQCLVNLAETAWAVFGRKAFRRVYGAAKLAVRLSDIDAQAHERLADMASRSGKRPIAVDELSAATRIAPTAPHYAAKLARALAHTDDHARAREATIRAERLTDFGLNEHRVAQLSIIQAFRRTGDPDRARKLARRRELTNELENIRVSAGDNPVPALRRLLASLDQGRDWERARVQTELGRAIRDTKNGSEELAGVADECFAEALTWFEDNYPHDNRVAELHSDRALALAALPERSGEALVEAETAVTLDPLRPSYREILSQVHEAGGDLESACKAADRALLLDPDDPALHFRLATLKWNLAESIADPDVHSRERRGAAHQFEEALKLYERSERAGRRMAHWWLGMSYFAMSEFSKVPAHFSFVLSSIAPGNGARSEERGLETVTELWLGMGYRKLQKFPQAERHLARAIHLTQILGDQGASLTTPLGTAVDDDRWPFGVVIALAHMQRAGCHADRGGSLDVAATDLERAHATLESLEQLKEIDTFVNDAWSDYHAETGRFLLAQGEPVKAIDELRSSAEFDPGEADVYLLLARAHARVAGAPSGNEDWRTHVSLGIDACRRTWEIAGEDHPDTRAAEEVAEQLARISVNRPSEALDRPNELDETPPARPKFKWTGGGQGPWQNREGPKFTPKSRGSTTRGREASPESTRPEGRPDDEGTRPSGDARS